MKRQRSRNRGGGGGGGKPQHNANRAFESNGPDGVKIRGAAQHVFEKYQQLARDALTAGDRVLGESYQQHAEHYFRVLRAVQPQRTASDIIGRDAISSGFDIDFEDENPAEAPDAQSEASEADGERGEWRQENRYEGRRDERQRNNGNSGGNNGYREDRANGGYQGDRQQRDDRNGYQGERQQRDDRPREDRNSYQGDRQQRDDRPRDDRNGYQGDRQQQRDERPRDERPRDDRPREQRNDRNDRYRDDRQRNERPADPLPVVEPQAAPLTTPVEQSGSPILRSHDGGVSHAPAFLQARTEPWSSEPTADEASRPKPRRRRAPRAAEGDGGDPSASQADATEDA